MHRDASKNLVSGTVQLFVEGERLYQDKLRDVSQEEIDHFLQRFLSLPSTIDETEREEIFQHELSRMVADKALGKESALPSTWQLKVHAPLSKMNRHNAHSHVLEQGDFINESRAMELFKQKKITLETREAFVICEINFSHPKTQEVMANAQIFDLLIGEMDRHGHNLIYEKIGKGIFIPHLIDNESSFSITFNDISRVTQEMLGLPRLIGHKMASKILHLTPQALQNTLVEAGLGKREIEVCLQRLQQLQNYILSIKEKYGFVKK